MMELIKKDRRSGNFVHLLLLVVFLFSFIVIATAPVWVGSTVNYTVVEETVYQHNLSKNITGFNNDVTFAFNTNPIQFNITWQNSSGIYVVSEAAISDWIVLANASWGNLTFMPSHDNQSGFFSLPIQAKNTTDDEAATTIFEFLINATNDLPTFTTISNSYSFPTNGSGNVTSQIVVSDEENHYPFNFSITFYNNCTHADWLNISDGVNCSVLDLINVSSTTANLSYVQDDNDVGVYWAQVNVTERSNITCASGYCDSSYTTRQSILQNISILILASVEVNTTDCSNENFTEGVAKNCSIVIRTVGETDFLNASSDASFLTYSGSPSDANWFYDTTMLQSTNFFREINVTVNANKTYVGNWNINFSALDLNYSTELNWSNFSIFVNWTGNTNTSLSTFDSAYNSSIDKNLTISFNISDEDFYIEDKDFYNETINVSIDVVNDSDSTSINNFRSLTTYVLSGIGIDYNLTFELNSSHVGNYTVYVNVSDASGFLNQSSFSLEVLSNSYPYWNQSNYSFVFTVNSTMVTTISNLTNVDLNRTYANDSNINDILSFSTSGEYPINFDLSSNGTLYFYPWKKDVGYWEFNVTVSDDLGLTNTTTWALNVSNVNSVPSLDNSSWTINGTNSFNKTVNQSDLTLMSFIVYDDDFLIYDNQTSSNDAYNENLTITVNITNTTDVLTAVNFSFYLSSILANSNQTLFEGNFTSTYNNTGNYTVTINVTDASNASDTIVFNLSIQEVNENPVVATPSNVLTSISNESFTLQIDANDSEDDIDGKDLNYTISNLTNSAPDLSINFTTGLISFNFSNNQSLAGFHQYNVSVNDSDLAVTSITLNVTVYGRPNVTLPLTGYSFSSIENTTYVFNATIDYHVNDTNLTYLVYLDNVTNFVNSSSYNYSNLTVVLNDSFIWNSTTNLTFDLNLSFFDETYGLFKNLSLIVYNSNYSGLNDTENFSMNVTHLNSPLVSIDNITSVSGFVGTDIDVNLSLYLKDIDADDLFHDQDVNFSLTQINSTAVTASFSDWMLSLGASSEGTYNLSIVASEINSTTNLTIRNVSTAYFTATFSDPPTTTVSGGGGGGSSRTETVVEYFSLKIIVPKDITVLPDNSVELDFSLQNNGNVDLVGVNLSSALTLGGNNNDDIDISFSENYIPLLKSGEKKDYRMRVGVNTKAVGDYTITIFGNVTSPKFSDWGDFHVKVQELDESQISQLLIFTEKLVSENPECLELREIYDEAKLHFDDGNFAEANRLASEAVRACEDAIQANDQIGFLDERFTRSVFYSVLISAVLFIGGLFYYFYRRVKFKKFINKEYI